MDVGQMSWEERRCAWCGSKEYDLLFIGPDRLEDLPGTFQMLDAVNVVFSAKIRD